MSDEDVKAEEINKNLIRDFGYFEGTNRANFRVILAVPSLTEVRSGVHAEYYGELFIRETIGTMRTEKYSYADNIWVLERQFGTNGHEVVDGDGYEPIFFFRNEAKGLRLGLRYDVCKLYALGTLVAKPIKTKKMIENAEREHYQKVFDKRMDILSQVMTWMGHLFRHNEATVMPGHTLPESPNLRRK